MALSNWLTYDEWNTAWLAGMLFGDKEKIHGLGDQLIAGMVCMHKAGYTFVGMNIDDNGNYEKVTQCCGDNASVLAEMLMGTFNSLQRSKDAIVWVKKNIPSLDFSEVEEMIKRAENPS